MTELVGLTFPERANYPVDVVHAKVSPAETWTGLRSNMAALRRSVVLCTQKLLRKQVYHLNNSLKGHHSDNNVLINTLL